METITVTKLERSDIESIVRDVLKELLFEKLQTEPQDEPDVIDVSIDELMLSTRTYNVLKKSLGVNKVSDLKGYSKTQLLRHKGIGVSVLREINYILKTYGYSLSK